MEDQNSWQTKDMDCFGLPTTWNLQLKPLKHQPDYHTDGLISITFLIITRGETKSEEWKITHSFSMNQVENVCKSD